MAHSNEYLSVIYTGSIVLFTLALKGAREIEFQNFFIFQIPSSSSRRFFVTRDIFFFDRSIDRSIAPWRRRNAGDERKTALLEKERERERESE